MRNFTLLFCLITCTSQAQQSTDFNQIIAPLDSPAVDFKEYLVQLAWINSPEGSIAAVEVLNAIDRSKNTKKEWMRDIQTTFNLNEANYRFGRSNVSTNQVITSKYDIATQERIYDTTFFTATNNNTFFPRFNLGVTVNLYSLLSQKDKNQISKRDILIAEHKVNQRKMAIRAETLSRYAQFKMTERVLLARRQVEQETNSAFVLIEQQYRTDEKTFEDFAAASSSFFQAQEARIRAENEVLQAQIRLEEIIGLMWAQVIHPAKI